MNKTIIEKLDYIKSMFNDDSVSEAVANDNTEEVAVKFEEVPLMDGSLISYEGELAPGVAVFIVTEEGESVPATEGTLQLGGELEGVSIVLDAEGIVSEIIDERTEGEEAPTNEEAEEAMSSEKVEAIVDTKMSDIDEPLNAIVEGVGSILKQNESLKRELDQLKEDFNAFKAEPETKKEEVKFATSEKKDRRSTYLSNLRKNK